MISIVDKLYPLSITVHMNITRVEYYNIIWTLMSLDAYVQSNGSCEKKSVFVFLVSQAYQAAIISLLFFTGRQVHFCLCD